MLYTVTYTLDEKWMYFYALFDERNFIKLFVVHLQKLYPGAQCFDRQTQTLPI